ncbi:hypothetical protein L2E82_45082 [Cichorium intybus]|uniref:Uncharacterized protein n=1 Tax=Cichorium intybus TaxID=13427 RepID=A0ACB8ZS41_CICIN|nr:hypothetical protein L2E82_45082 [Cichorium intybus]
MKPRTGNGLIPFRRIRPSFSSDSRKPSSTHVGPELNMATIATLSRQKQSHTTDDPEASHIRCNRHLLIEPILILISVNTVGSSSKAADLLRSLPFYLDKQNRRDQHSCKPPPPQAPTKATVLPHFSNFLPRCMHRIYLAIFLLISLASWSDYIFTNKDPPSL